MEEDAGGCALVVGDARAIVEGERSKGRGGVGGLVVFTGEDDVEAAGGEERAEAEGEREGDVLLDDVVRDARAAVGAAVGGIDDDGGGMELRLRQRDEGVMEAFGGGLGFWGWGWWLAGGCCGGGVGDGEGVLVGRRCGLRLGLLLRLLLDPAAEGQRREREKQKRAEEGDVSCRSLLRRDQAAAFGMDERRSLGSIVPGEMRGERRVAGAELDWWHKCVSSGSTAERSLRATASSKLKKRRGTRG